MSVLQRKELEDSPLADLHAIASELDIESYRSLRRADLIKSILDVGPGSDSSEDADDSDAGEDERPARRPRRSSRGGRGGRARKTDSDDSDDEASTDSSDNGDGDGDGDEDDRPQRRRRGGRSGGRGRSREAEVKQDDADDGEDSEVEGEPVSGVLDVLSGGSGFVRVAGLGHSAEDVYISPAQIRRCELRSGDEVAGPARPARRGERHPSLVRVEQVNGADAEPPAQRPHFDELTPVFATAKLDAPTALKSVPFGRGSRVAISGGPGAGATRLLREIVVGLQKIKKDAPSISVVLIGARPEELTDWQREAGVPVSGGSFDGSLEAQAQAADLAIERGKRAVERGEHAVVLIDSLEPLQPATARRLFGAARNAEQGGSLTVVATVGMSWEAQRQATTRVALDAPDSKGKPQLSDSRSQTLRDDLLS